MLNTVIYGIPSTGRVQPSNFGRMTSTANRPRQFHSARDHLLGSGAKSNTTTPTRGGLGDPLHKRPVVLFLDVRIAARSRSGCSARHISPCFGDGPSSVFSSRNLFCSLRSRPNARPAGSRQDRAVGAFRTGIQRSRGIFRSTAGFACAIPAFEAAVKLDPTSWEGHYNLALALLEKGD